MDLFLSANGLGSCWQGIPRLTKELLESSNLEFVIVMAFGKPKDPQSLHRTNISEFKRKPLKKITDINGVDNLLEAARVAPSGANWQPWFFTGNSGLIYVRKAKSSSIKSFASKIAHFKELDYTDIGIAIYHLQVAAEHFGKKTEIVFDQTAKVNASKNLSKFLILTQQNSTKFCMLRFFGFRKCYAFSSTPKGYEYITSLKIE